MSDVAHWVLHHLGAVFAASAAICLALAGLLVVWVFRTTSPPHRHDTASRDLAEKLRRLKLQSGDVKALANLAIQRHMDNKTFLHHLNGQRSCRELLQYFNMDLQQKLAHEPADQSSKSMLAAACLNEIERLEREFVESVDVPRLFDSGAHSGFSQNQRGK